MPRPLPDPLVELSFANVPNHPDLDQLAAIWNVFTKCGEHLESGRRLENMTWRLWFREANTAFDATSTGCTPTPIATPRSSRAPSFALGSGSTNTILAAAAARATSRLMRTAASSQPGLYDVNIPSDPESEEWSSADEATERQEASRKAHAPAPRRTTTGNVPASRQRKSSKAGPSRRQNRQRPSSASSTQSAQEAAPPALVSPPLSSPFAPSSVRYPAMSESSPSSRTLPSASNTEQLSSSAATSPVEYRERDRSRPLSSSSAFGSRARVRLRNQSLTTAGDGSSQRRRPRPLSLQETIESLIGTGGKIRTDKIGDRGMESSCELSASRDLSAIVAGKRDVGVGADGQKVNAGGVAASNEKSPRTLLSPPAPKPTKEEAQSTVAPAAQSANQPSPQPAVPSQSSKPPSDVMSPPDMIRSISADDSAPPSLTRHDSSTRSEAGSDRSSTSRATKPHAAHGKHAAHVHTSALAARRNKSTTALHRPGHGHAAHPPLQARRSAVGVRGLTLTRATDAGSTAGKEKEKEVKQVAAAALEVKATPAPAPVEAPATGKTLSVSPTVRRQSIALSALRSPRSRTVELPSSKQGPSKQELTPRKKKAPVKFTMGCDDSDFEDESDQEVEQQHIVSQPQPQPQQQPQAQAPPIAKPTIAVPESPVSVNEDEDDDGWSSDEPTPEELAAERAAKAARLAAEEAARQAAMFQKQPIRSASAADVRLPPGQKDLTMSRGHPSPEYEAPAQPKGLLSSMFNRGEMHPPPGQLAGRPHASAADLRHVPSGLSMTSAGPASRKADHHHSRQHHRHAHHDRKPHRSEHPTVLSTSLASTGMPLRTSKSAVALPVLNTVASQTTLKLHGTPDGPALDAADGALQEGGSGLVGSNHSGGNSQRQHRGSVDDGDATLQAAPSLKRQQSSTMLERLSALTKRGSAVFLPGLASQSNMAGGRGPSNDDAERRKARTRSDERLMEMQMNAQREVREAYATSSHDGGSSHDGASMSEEGGSLSQRRRSSGASSVVSNPSVPLAAPQRTASSGALAMTPQQEAMAIVPPPGAAPQTPRTTRRNMLRDELSESLRQNLLWERQSRSRMLGIANIGPLPQQQQQQQPAQHPAPLRPPSPSPPLQHHEQVAAHQARQPSPRRAQHRNSVLAGGPLRALTPSIAPQQQQQQLGAGLARDRGAHETNGDAPPRRSSSSGNLADRGYGEGGFHHSGW